MIYAQQPAYAPQPQVAIAPQPQPIMQGYAPQMAPRNNGWWKWALAAGLGGLGVGGVLLGNRMAENDKEEIKKNNRRKWMPSFDMDPLTMTSVITQLPRFAMNTLGMVDSIRDAAHGHKTKKSLDDAKKLNEDLAFKFRYLKKGSRNPAEAKKMLDEIKAKKQEDIVSPLIMDRLQRASKGTWSDDTFSQVRSTGYYDRYKDYNFNIPMAVQPQVAAAPQPQPVMQGYAPSVYQPVQQYYAPPSPGRNLSRLALGLSALAALGGGAYALKKANENNEALAKSREPSFMNKINVADLISPLMGATNIAADNLDIVNKHRTKRINAIREDIDKNVKSIIRDGEKYKGKKKEDDLGHMYKSKDIARQVVSAFGMLSPFAKKFVQHQMDKHDNEG